MCSCTTDVLTSDSQSLENFILEGAFNNDALWGFLAYIGHLRDTRNKLPQLMYSATDGNITLAMENVARSLTNQIRSGPQSMDLSGTVSRTEVYMRVQWQSLAYPTTLLFLVSAIVRDTSCPCGLYCSIES